MFLSGGLVMTYNLAMTIRGPEAVAVATVPVAAE